MNARASRYAVAITGMGVVTSVGTSVSEFRDSLFAARGAYDTLRRTGREADPPFIGAELDDSVLTTPGNQKADRLAARSTLEGRTALHAVNQAWQDAGLPHRGIPAERTGLVIGGASSDYREHNTLRENYQSKLQYMRPSYAASCWDCHHVGLLSEAFGIQGEGLSVGGASAGGAVAIIQAARQIQCGLTDVSVAVGPLTDLSRFELQALRSTGALGSERYADRPDVACRPFDRQSDGFIFGEGCGAIILERFDEDRPQPDIHAVLSGTSLVLQGKHGPAPVTEGQQRAILQALQQAGLTSGDIDYVSTHGTGTPLGDDTELETLRHCGLQHAAINATKSITGHCLTASGALEVIATVLQLQEGRIHPTRNLSEPIDESFQWNQQTVVRDSLQHALSTSFAFDGICAALVISSRSSVQT